VSGVKLTSQERHGNQASFMEMALDIHENGFSNSKTILVGKK